MTIEKEIVADKKLLRKHLRKLLQTVSEKELVTQCIYININVFINNNIIKVKFEI